MTAPKLLTTIEVAEMLGISKSRVKQLVKDGRLKPYRDRPRLYAQSAVAALYRSGAWPLPVGGKRKNRPKTPVTSTS